MNYSKTSYSECSPLLQGAVSFHFTRFRHWKKQGGRLLNYKKRLLLIAVMSLMSTSIFVYGIGVGRYQWFPYYFIEDIKTNLGIQVSEGNTGTHSTTHKNARHRDILYESLRKDIRYHVILLAGQSNMVGAGNIADLQSSEQQLPTNIDYYNFGRGSGLIYSIHKFGPEISLSRELHSFFPNENFVFIKYALGGSSLLDWSPQWTQEKAEITGNAHFGSLYKKFIEKIKNITQGSNVKFSALIWMQGETDANFPLVAKEYFDNFSKFIKSIRRDINEPNLPVLIGHINPPLASFPGVNIVRNAQERAAKELLNVQLINTDGIHKWNDQLHYDSQGQLELGDRFSRALKVIITAQKAEKLEGLTIIADQAAYYYFHDKPK